MILDSECFEALLRDAGRPMGAMTPPPVPEVCNVWGCSRVECSHHLKNLRIYDGPVRPTDMRGKPGCIMGGREDDR